MFSLPNVLQTHKSSHNISTISSFMDSKTISINEIVHKSSAGIKI